MDGKYYKWHEIKSKINSLDSSNFYFRERDIWWCYYGANIGYEQNGKDKLFLRPVLIFKKLSRHTCLAIPLSTQIKNGNHYFFLLSETNSIRTATLSQIKMIDVRRLRDKIDTISKIEFQLIKEKVIDLIR